MCPCVFACVCVHARMCVYAYICVFMCMETKIFPQVLSTYPLRPTGSLTALELAEQTKLPCQHDPFVSSTPVRTVNYSTVPNFCYATHMLRVLNSCYHAYSAGPLVIELSSQHNSFLCLIDTQLWKSYK